MNSDNHDHNYRSICPPLSRPDDFDEFWQQTLNELATVPMDINIFKTFQHADGLLERWFHFPSLKNIDITAYCLSWDNKQDRPLVVYTHGYLGQCEVMLDWARQGLNIIGIDLRGMGRSQQASLPIADEGYILTGIESPQNSILRGVVCDFIRASELTQALSLTSSRQIFYGHSFGGALSLIASALSNKPDLLVSGVPTLGWAKGRRKLVKRGSGHEINLYLQRHPEQEDQLMQVLRYFDTMNFADRIQCPCLVGAGQQDDVVPVETVYAICNHLACPHEIREMPVSHSDLPLEALWLNFEAEWLQLATQGPPTDFGQRALNLKQIA